MTRQILNTLFVTNDRAYVRLDHDTLRVEDEDGARLLQAPLLHLGQIVLYGSSQMSGQAMQRCAADGRCVTFLDYAGRFKARVVGPTSGNVLLRQAQYAAHASEERARSIARSIVAAKIRNSRSLIVRGAREIVSRREALATCADAMANQLAALPDQASLDAIRGIEGMAASLYFERFGDLINRPAEEFSFRVRTRRPPRDRVNAVLSFLYALLTADCVSACEGVGLDPQFGFLHVLRPGRPSLALDLMEELRPLWVDRLTLSLINLRQLRPEHF
jgi:CRISPR-associated protein Cas1